MPKSISFSNQGVQLSNSEDSELTIQGIDISSDYMTLPSGNTAQRPAAPEAGMMRFNTETANVEGYMGTEWVNIAA
jgi:hypothetical protein